MQLQFTSSRRRLRILYITDSLMQGGLEYQLTELVVRLPRTDFDPHVVCLFGEHQKRSMHFAARLLENNIPLYRLDMERTQLGRIRALFQLVQIIWKLKPEIIHTFNLYSNWLTRLIRPFLPFSVKLIGAVRGEYARKYIICEFLTQWACTVI